MREERGGTARCAEDARRAADDVRPVGVPPDAADGGHGGEARRGADAHRATDPHRPGDAYRIEDLAHLSGATVRTIRAYQDRGLLPRPERRGRANLYSDAHLTRLGQIAGLLDRGYTLASIKELLEAWDAGRGLGGVLGLVAEVEGPWTEEEATRISRTELAERFGGLHDDAAVADAVELGVLEPVPGDPDGFRVPSPQELAAAAELHRAGVPLSVIGSQLRELRGQVEHIASRFLEFTTEHVFARYLGDSTPSDAETAEAAQLVRRLRPLARQTVDAELARAMKTFATLHLRQHLRQGPAPRTREEVRTVALPASTMRAVENLVGAEHVAEFLTRAAERELHNRAMDRLTSRQRSGEAVDEHRLE